MASEHEKYCFGNQQHHTVFPDTSIGFIIYKVYKRFFMLRLKIKEAKFVQKEIDNAFLVIKKILM